jgi:hypothetical protein
MSGKIFFAEFGAFESASKKEEGRVGWERGPELEAWVAEIQFNNSINLRRSGVFFS